MSLFQHYADSLRVKVFENEEELNNWFKEQSGISIIDFKFTSVVLPDGTIKDRFMVLYKIYK
jgi:hypothetical protein